MARTRIFVSYSHDDIVWLERFRQHVSILERLGAIDLWADTRIGAGARWADEIEDALTSARIAVLLVSPSFLASRFIWDDEMPRIVAHSKQGMEVLPLIVRPCAWRLADELECLQARPMDGRALSLGSESQVDSDLSAFTYELAAKTGHSPAARGLDQAGDAPDPQAEETATSLLGRWSGFYNRTRPVQLEIGALENNRFRGSLFYVDEETITMVEGELLERWPANDPLWLQIDDRSDDARRVGVIFCESGYVRRGISGIDFAGEYRAIVTGASLEGAWFSGTRLVGVIRLTRGS